MKTVTLRLANVYGPGPTSSRADRGVLNQMVSKALRGEALTVYGEGNAVRDYVYIDDIVRALVLAGAHAATLSGDHFVIGNGSGTTIADAFALVAERVERATGVRAPVAHVAPPEGQSPIEERDFVADTKSFREATGWEPQVSLREGIDRTIKYWLEQSGRT